MNQEVEIKLPVDDQIDWASRLSCYPTAKARFFEDNFLFDRQGQLMKMSSVLRVRHEGSRWVVTFKGPKTIDDEGIKTRLEYETGIDDGDTLVLILKALGYHLWFRYQKYRTVFRADDLLIMLDETPIGTYIELEGPKPQISAVRHTLGLGETKPISESYIGLYLSQRSADDPKFMLF